VLRGREAGKHVFVEKPLAIREDDVERISAALPKTDRILCVGFNRRFAPLTLAARKALDGRVGPLVVNITVNAGELPDDHWTNHPEAGGGRLVGEACHFIDLARYLVGHPILDVKLTTARGRERQRLEAVSLIQLAFEDGSIASVQYLANGPGAFPKERVELFWDGKGLRIDNFRSMKGWGVKGISGWPGRRQDKGQKALVAAFVEAIRGGGVGPIAHDELLEVSRESAALSRSRIQAPHQ